MSEGFGDEVEDEKELEEVERKDEKEEGDGVGRGDAGLYGLIEGELVPSS